MPLFDRLDAVRDRWNVLDHSFYERWSNGDLSRAELDFYAGEYRHAVIALAEASEATADACEAAVRAELDQHAADERAHVTLWDRFAEEVDAELGRPPLAETRACARAWTAARDELEGLVVLYAVESNQPAIAQTKLKGLVDHYGFHADAPAAEYFTLHAELDHEHAAQSRELLEERFQPADLDRLVEAAEGALAGNWELLDGVERRFG